ncbi:MAG: hypothetical protein HZB51_08570 [Chloroflexi bacterium]|nr:hypothetical protein [Chloroflexota bacterium]
MSHKILKYWLAQYHRYTKYWERLTVPWQFAYWRRRERELLSTSEKGYRLKLEELNLNAESLARLKSQQRDGQEIVIAEVDKNGSMFSYYGTIPNVPNGDAGKFTERTRFAVQLVARNGYMGIRKSFTGRRLNFINELKILYHLNAQGCHIPAILGVDFDKLTLTISYIAGHVLRDDLAALGAQFHAKYPRKRADLTPDERRSIRAMRSEQGRQFLRQVIDESFIEHVYQEICKIHAVGVVNIDITYGNILIERYSKQPYLIDFEHATLYSNLNAQAQQILTRRDISKFDSLFGTHKVIEKPRLLETAYQKSSLLSFAWAGFLSILMQLPLTELMDTFV